MRKGKQGAPTLNGYEAAKLIREILTLRNEITIPAKDTDLFAEIPLFQDLPSFDKTKIEQIKIGNDSMDQIKTFLKNINFSYSFQIPIIDSITRMTKKQCSSTKYFAMIVYYQAISLIYTNPEGINNVSFSKTMDCLTKCIFGPTKAYVSFFAETLFYLSLCNPTFEWDTTAVDSAFSHIGSNTELSSGFYAIFVKLMKIITDNPSLNRTEPLLSLIIRLIAEKRSFIMIEKIVSFMHVITPFIYSMNEIALTILAMLSQINMSETIHEVYTLLPSNFISIIRKAGPSFSYETVQQSAFILESDKSETTIDNLKKHYTEGGSLFSTRQVSDIEEILEKTEAPFNRLTKPLQKMTLDLAAALEQSDSNCSISFFTTFIRLISALKGEAFYFNVFAAFLMIFAKCPQPSFVEARFDTFYCPIVFSSEYSIFDGSIDILLNEFRCQITDCMKMTNILLAYVMMASHYPPLFAEILLRIMPLNKSQLQAFACDSFLDQSIDVVFALDRYYQNEAVTKARFSIINFLFNLFNHYPHMLLVSKYFIRRFLLMGFVDDLSDNTWSVFGNAFSNLEIQNGEKFGFVSDFIIEIFEKERESELYTNQLILLIHTVRDICANNGNAVPTFEPILTPALVFCERVDRADVLEDLLDFVTSISLYHMEYSLSDYHFQLLARSLQNIKEVNFTDKIIGMLTWSSSTDCSEEYLIMRPSFIPLLFVSTQNCDVFIEPFIKLSAFSRFNTYAMHDGELDFLLIKTLIGKPFTYKSIVIDTKVTESLASQLLESIMTAKCAPSIVKQMIKLVKRKLNPNFYTLMSNALITAKKQPQHQKSLGSKSHFLEINDFPADILDGEFTISMQVRFDPHLLSTLNTSYCLFSIDDDEGHHFGMYTNRSLLYGTLTQPESDLSYTLQISNGLPPQKWSNYNFIFRENGNSRYVYVFKDNINCPIAEYQHVSFGLHTKIKFGGIGNIFDNQSIFETEVGSVGKIAIYDRAIAGTDVFPPNPFYANYGKTDLNEVRLPNTVFDTIFDVMKRDNYVSGLLGSAFGSKEAIESGLPAAAMNIYVGIIRYISHIPHRFGLFPIIASNLIKYKYASFVLFQAFITALSKADDDLQMEMFDSIVGNIGVWVNAPKDDLRQILFYWSTEMIDSFSYILRRRSYFQRYVTDVSLFNDDQELLKMYTLFVKRIALLRFDDSDTAMLMAAAGSSENASLYIDIAKDITQMIAKTGVDVRNTLFSLLEKNDYEFVKKAILTLIELPVGDETELAMIIILKTSKFRTQLLEDLSENLYYYPSLYQIICGLSLLMESEKSSKAIPKLRAIVDHSFGSIKAEGIWYLFPVLLSFKVDEGNRLLLMEFITTIALNKGIGEIERIFGLFQLLGSRIRESHLRNLAAYFIKTVGELAKKTEMVKEFIFISATTCALFSFENTTHHKRLLEMFDMSPFGTGQKAEGIPEVKTLEDIVQLFKEEPPTLTSWIEFDSAFDVMAKLALENHQGVESLDKYSSLIELMDQALNHKKKAKAKSMDRFIECYKEFLEEKTFKASVTNLFQKQCSENTSLIMSCIEHTNEVQRNLRCADYKYTIPRENSAAKPSNYEVTEVKDSTRIGAFCPMRLKKSKHLHDYPPAPFKRGGLICDLIELNKIREFYYSVENSEIHLANSSSHKVIKLCDVVTLVKRERCGRSTGIEIYTVSRRSYLLNFKFSDAEKALEMIPPQSMPKAQIQNVSKVQRSIDHWMNGYISNFEFIMKLNMLSGRSFNDPSAYPFIPRVISNIENITVVNQLPSFQSQPIPNLTRVVSGEGDLKSDFEMDAYPADFFYSPHIFENEKLPCSSVHEFVYELRKALESDQITAMLPVFIDKVWGPSMPSDFMHERLLTKNTDPRVFMKITRVYSIKLDFADIIYAAETRPMEFSIISSTGRFAFGDLIFEGDLRFAVHSSKDVMIKSQKFLPHLKELWSVCEGKEVGLRSNTELSIKYHRHICSSAEAFVYCDSPSLIITQQSRIPCSAAVQCLTSSSRFDVVVYGTVDGRIHFHSIRSGRQICASKECDCIEIAITQEFGFVIARGADRVTVFSMSGEFVGEAKVRARKVFPIVVHGLDVIVIDTGSEVLMAKPVSVDDLVHVDVEAPIAYSVFRPTINSYVFLTCSASFTIIPFSNVPVIGLVNVLF